MSIVSVHGPTMSTPPVVESDHIIVNILSSPEELEFKSKVRSSLASEDAYEWDFGDGTPRIIDGYKVTHTFAPGTFVVALSVETTEGLITDQVEITVNGDGHRDEVAPEELEEAQREAA
jgi:PKD repeat protein